LANTITDNRTKVADANGTTDGITGTWTGSTSVALDTDVKIEGTGSIAEQMTNSVRTILWNRGSTFSLANTHVYIWVNCGVVGLLDTKAAGGFRIRFCGASQSDYFEVYVGGSDSWPNAIAGGWVQFVVDVVAAQASPSATGGTPPAITAIQHIGAAAITTTMTKVSDNTWVDAIYTLADGVAGILVQGRNGGTTPWNFADVFAQLGQGSGAIKQGPAGSWVLNTSFQCGINDTTTHEFSDTNALILWDNQEFAAADLYRVIALGNVGGTTNFTLGSKSGTGADAVGSQGVTFQAAATGVRWDMDFSDPNLDLVGLYGCNFVHGDTFDLDDPAVDLATCLFLDCTRAVVSNASIVRATVVDANTADGVAFMVTDDMGDIRNSNFAFSDGHAIELNAATPTSQNNIGNQFGGYTNTVNSTDAAILNSAAGALTISSSGGSNLQTNSYRNTGGGSVSILNNISVTLTGLRDNTEVRVLDNTTREFLAGTESATDGSVDNRSFTFSLAASTIVDIAVFNVNYILPPNNRIENFTIPTSDTSIPLSQIPDRAYNNP